MYGARWDQPNGCNSNQLSSEKDMVVAQYTVRTLDPEDEGEVLRLLQMSLGDGPSGGRQPSYWHWKHVTNYFGQSYARVACDEGGQLIGMRAFMQWELTSSEKTIRAVRAVDTATHPDCRRMGIFSTLTRQVVNDVTSDGVSVIFNSPNNDVLPGYLKLGWHHVTIIHPMIKVLNYPAFTLGLVRNKLGSPASGPHGSEGFFRDKPSSVAELLERRWAVEHLVEQNEQTWLHPESFRTRRSWDYLSWRYAQHPTIPYYAASLEHQGRIEGCAIFRTNTRFGLKELVLCELLLSEPTQDLAARLLNEVRSLTRADYLITFFPESTFQRAALNKLGFRPVPRRGMNFAVNPLASDWSTDPLRFGNWGLTMGDLELF